MTLDSRIPGGPLADKWERRKFENKLVNPANRRKYEVIIVGTGLAGASAAAALGEQGYRVKLFCILDSARRAHSIAAQGGINAAKNYRNDGDSVYRLFYDTVKGGDYRAREANVYRLAQLSVNIIDQCVATGVPFAREYGGLLDNRSFGGAQVSRTFYARGQTGQQLLLGAYQSMLRQVDAGTVTLFTRREMLDLVVVNGQARGIITRNLITGELERHEAQAVLLCTGGYGTRLLPVDQRRELQRDRRVACPQARRALRQSVLHADSPDVHSGQRRPPVEADADVESPAQRRPRLGAEEAGRQAAARADSGSRARLLPRTALSQLRQSRARATSRRAPQSSSATRGAASATPACRCISISMTPSSAWASRSSRPATATCSRCTSGSPPKTRTRFRCAFTRPSTTRWVACGSTTTFESTIPGLFVLGEANFSDHGANRLGASALMQGLADGYFIAPYTVANYLAGATLAKVSTDHDAFKEAASSAQGRIDKVLGSQGQAHRARSSTVSSATSCGTTSAWRATTPGSRRRSEKIRPLRDEFWQDVTVPGDKNNLNPMLDYAGRVADYMEFGELLTLDALQRNESCGGHFREEFQTPDGEALRDDDQLQLCRGLGVHGRGNAARCSTRSRSCSTKSHPTQRSYKYERQIDRFTRQPARSGASRPTDQPGRRLVDYVARDISTDMSFLEMLDVVNEDLIRKGEDTIAFDSDCREGICGACGCVINGVAARTRPGRHHLPAAHAPVLRRPDHHHRAVARQGASPCLKDLTVDRSAFDRILAAGGYISAGVGGAQDANAIPVPKDQSDRAMDSAACIGCGACVAACKNAAAHLFTSAKITHLALLPQGATRARAPRGADGRADGGRRLRQLLERRRMRGRLPEADPDLEHRQDGARVCDAPSGKASACEVRPSWQHGGWQIDSTHSAYAMCHSPCAMTGIYIFMTSTSSLTAAADFISAACSSGSSLISNDLLDSARAQLHRHAEKLILHAVLALQVDRARQNLLLVLQDRLDHLGGRLRPAHTRRWCPPIL